MDHPAITDLASGIVVDKAKVDRLSAENMAALFAEVYAQGKRVLIVPNSIAFFSAKELLSQLDHNGSDWPLIAEKFEIDISAEDRACLEKSLAIRKALTEAIVGVKAAYDFDPVPDNWTVPTRIVFEGSSLRRRAVSGGYGGGHSIGVKTLERVWLVASAFWAGTSDRMTISVSADGYNKTAEVHSHKVQVGCQPIERFELEQVALHKGWDFPKA